MFIKKKKNKAYQQNPGIITANCQFSQIMLCIESLR